MSSNRWVIEVRYSFDPRNKWYQLVSFPTRREAREEVAIYNELFGTSDAKRRCRRVK